MTGILFVKIGVKEKQYGKGLSDLQTIQLC